MRTVTLILDETDAEYFIAWLDRYLTELRQCPWAQDDVDLYYWVIHDKGEHWDQFTQRLTLHLARLPDGAPIYEHCGEPRYYPHVDYSYIYFEISHLGDKRVEINLDGGSYIMPAAHDFREELVPEIIKRWKEAPSLFPDEDREASPAQTEVPTSDVVECEEPAPGKPLPPDPQDTIVRLAKESLKALPCPERWALMAKVIEEGYPIRQGPRFEVRIKGEPTRRTEYRAEKRSTGVEKPWGPRLLESNVDKVTFIIETELEKFSAWLWRYLDPIRLAREPYLTADDHDYRFLTYSTEGQKRLYHRVTWVFLLDMILPKEESLRAIDYMTLLHEVEIGKRGAALDVFPLAPKRIEVNLRCSDDALLDFQADLQAEIIGRWPEAQVPSAAKAQSPITDMVETEEVVPATESPPITRLQALQLVTEAMASVKAQSPAKDKREGQPTPMTERIFKVIKKLKEEDPDLTQDQTAAKASQELDEEITVDTLRYVCRQKKYGWKRGKRSRW